MGDTTRELQTIKGGERTQYQKKQTTKQNRKQCISTYTLKHMGNKTRAETQVNIKRPTTGSKQELPEGTDPRRPTKLTRNAEQRGRKGSGGGIQLNVSREWAEQEPSGRQPGGRAAAKQEPSGGQPGVRADAEQETSGGRAGGQGRRAEQVSKETRRPAKAGLLRRSAAKASPPRRFATKHSHRDAADSGANRDVKSSEKFTKLRTLDSP